MGLFFTLLVAGLNAKVPTAKVTALAYVPPLGYIFAAFLGYNALKSLLGPALLSHVPPA